VAVHEESNFDSKACALPTKPLCSLEEPTKRTGEGRMSQRDGDRLISRRMRQENKRSVTKRRELQLVLEI
jgi:hypothetical protein